MNSESDNSEVIHSADDNEYRVFCEICEIFVMKDIIRVI